MKPLDEDKRQAGGKVCGGGWHSPSAEMLAAALEWDVAGWAFALQFWAERVPVLSGKRVLELGARDGGISLYLAQQGAEMVCSDYHGPTERAHALHERYGVSDRVTYADLDATAIARDSGEFDVVCFKSILGGIAGGGRLALAPRVTAEIHRVLKPGGVLLFAENLAGSWLHMLARRTLVKWGRNWHYFSLKELSELLCEFSEIEMRCSGFLTAFGRSERQRGLLRQIDKTLMPLLPNRWRYIAAGYARKAT